VEVRYKDDGLSVVLGERIEEKEGELWRGERKDGR